MGVRLKGAYVCGRAMTHSAGSLQKVMLDLMKNFFRERLGDIVTSAASRVIIYEAAVTPKPGLVDMANSAVYGRLYQEKAR